MRQERKSGYNEYYSLIDGYMEKGNDLAAAKVQSLYRIA